MINIIHVNIEAANATPLECVGAGKCDANEFDRLFVQIVSTNKFVEIGVCWMGGLSFLTKQIVSFSLSL